MLTNRSAPPVTVTPVLVYPDVRAAVAWLTKAFGFEERVRVGEAHRAQLRVGEDGAVIVADMHGDQVAPSAGSVTHVIKVRVSDVDAAFIRAREAGAGGDWRTDKLRIWRTFMHTGGPYRSSVGIDPDHARCRTRGVGRGHRLSLVTCEDVPWFDGRSRVHGNGREISLTRAVLITGYVLGFYLIVRAIAEPFVIDVTDPATYREDWGGPSLFGVLVVHCGPGLLAAVLMGWHIARRRARSQS